MLVGFQSLPFSHALLVICHF